MTNNNRTLLFTMIFVLMISFIGVLPVSALETKTKVLIAESKKSNETVILKGIISKYSKYSSKYLLESEGTKYVLAGNLVDVKKLISKYVEVTGVLNIKYISKMNTIQVEKCVEILKPVLTALPGRVTSVSGVPKPVLIPEPKPLIVIDDVGAVSYSRIEGYLSVTKPDIAVNPELYGTYIYYLKTTNGAYKLTGTTKGMQNFNGKNLEVKGNYIETLVATEYPGFNVVSFAEILVPVIDTPTTTSLINKVHSVISDKPLYYNIAQNTNDIYGGNATMSWVENTQTAFFNARITVAEDSNNTISDSGMITNVFYPTTYEVTLTKVANSTSDSIEGSFDIRKNGVLLASGISGKVYGISMGVGNYFKFYSDDQVYHLSAYITSRYDY